MEVVKLVAENPLLLIVGTIIFMSLLVIILPEARAERLVDFLERIFRLVPFTSVIRELRKPRKQNK